MKSNMRHRLVCPVKSKNLFRLEITEAHGFRTNEEIQISVKPKKVTPDVTIVGNEWTADRYLHIETRSHVHLVFRSTVVFIFSGLHLR